MTVMRSNNSYTTALKLQRVLNAAAHLVSGTRKFDRGLTHLLHADQHWLDVPERMQYKLGITEHRCQQHKAPQYLIDCVTPASDIASRHRLRSASCHRLLVPRYQLSSLGRCSFTVAGPTTWNSLSADLCDPTLATCSDESFRRSLKTFLFAKYQCVQRIRGFSTTMRYINRHYLCIYLSIKYRNKIPERQTIEELSTTVKNQQAKRTLPVLTPSQHRERCQCHVSTVPCHS